MSEPLMTRRKSLRRHRNRAAEETREQSGRCLSCCPGGVRRKGGVSLICGWYREQVNLTVDRVACGSPEGEPHVAESIRGRVPMRRPGADRPVGVMTPGNAGRAKGADYPGVIGGQL